MAGNSRGISFKSFQILSRIGIKLYWIFFEDMTYIEIERTKSSISMKCPMPPKTFLATVQFLHLQPDDVHKIVKFNSTMGAWFAPWKSRACIRSDLVTNLSQTLASLPPALFNNHSNPCFKYILSNNCQAFV